MITTPQPLLVPVLLLLLVLPFVVLAYQPPSHQPPRQGPPSRSQHDSRSSSRRDLLCITTTTLATASSLLFLGSSRPIPAHAANAREAIANAVSRIPGYGAPDTLYPSFFAGEWVVTREVVGLTIPPEEADNVDPQDLAQAKEQQGEKLKYTIRFLPC